MSELKSVLMACSLYEYKSGTSAIEATKRITQAFGEDALSDESCIQNWFEQFANGNETLEYDVEPERKFKKKGALQHNVTTGVSKSLIRACLLYEHKNGTRAAEATRRICKAFGAGTVSERCSRKWFQKFTFGLETLVDAPRSGRPSGLCETQLKDTIECNANQSCQELARHFNVSDETIRTHLHRLGKTWKLNKWIPQEISPTNKLARMTICSSLLSRHRNESFLPRLLTSGEKWITYNSIKRANEGLPCETQKVLLCVWWTARGIVHFELLTPEQATKTETYVEQLQRVAAALTDERKTLGITQPVIFQHDNTQPCATKATSDIILKLGWELLPHPPFSPDIAPSDYHLFIAIDTHFQGRRFKDAKDIEKALKTFIETMDKTFFKNGINKLPERWEKVIDADGNYYGDLDY